MNKQFKESKESKEKYRKAYDDTKDDLRRKTSEIDTSKKKHNDKTTTLEATIKNHNDRTATLEATIKNHKDRTATLEATIKNHNDRTTTLEATIKKQDETIKNLNETVKSLEEDNNNLIKRITDNIRKPRTPPSPPKPTTPPTPKKRIHILGDSNTSRMLPTLLKDNTREWILTDKLYRPNDIDKYIESPNNHLDQADTIILLTGTNLIKDGNYPAEIQQKIATTLNKLPKRPLKIIVELPPFRTSSTRNIDTQIVNQLLEDTAKATPRTSIAKYRTSLNQYNRRTIMEDELHIIKGGTAAEIIYNAISKEINNPPKDEPTTPQKEDIATPDQDRSRKRSRQTSEEIHIPKGAVGLVLGRGKQNLTKWTRDHGTQIEIITKRDNTSEPGDLTIEITGEREQRRTVKDTINSIIRKHSKRESTREEMKTKGKTTTCSEFEKGNCSYGDRCFFLHTRTRPHHASTSPQQSRNRSKSRHSSSRHRSPASPTTQRHRSPKPTRSPPSKRTHKP